jgi:hypothetical protein
MKAVIRALMFVSLWLTSEVSAQITPPDTLVKWGERLTYKVSYGGFYLGNVIVNPFQPYEYQGKTVWLGSSIVKSNPDLWFVGDREEHFWGVIDKNDTTVFEYHYWKDDIDDRKDKEEQYIADYEARRVTYIIKGDTSVVENIDEPKVFGMGFFMLSRMHANLGELLRIPIVVSGEDKNINVQYGSPDDTTYWSAPIEGLADTLLAVPVNATANIKGPFGFNGNFSGFYSADERKIPLEARLKVWLGKVRVTLEKYEIIEIDEYQVSKTRP